MQGKPRATAPSGRNVVIYSDGTGQAGGFRFDETRTNVYKMFRASRCGPDSNIDPCEQVAFYDPGLGSQADGANVFGKALRWITTPWHRRPASASPAI